MPCITSGLRPSMGLGLSHRRVTVSIMKKITITNIMSSSRNCTSQLIAYRFSWKRFSKPRMNLLPNLSKSKYLYLLYLEKSLRRIEIGITWPWSKQKEKSQKNCLRNITQVLLQCLAMWKKLWIRRLSSTTY